MCPNCGLINTPKLSFYLPSSNIQVQKFKKDISKCDTQDSTMNVHKKTQFTCPGCVVKGLSCDTPLEKILKFTIHSSNASSSSTKVFEFPHTMYDSRFTNNGFII